MNLTLFKLRNKIKRDKSGMGSLVGVILGGVLLSTLVASGTSWYLSMRNNLGNTEDKLEAQTIAMSEWERLSHMSLDELEANRNNFKTPYSAGTGSQFSVSVNLGEKGTFNGGTCGNVSGGYANCFKNTTITVYRDGNRMFTTRTLPLMAGDYTRKEIDAKLAALDTKINNNTNKINNNSTAITNLTNRLNGKEFIKNKTPDYDINLRYEKKAGEDKFSLHAYNGNTEIPLASQSSSVDDSGYGNIICIPKHYVAPSNGFIIIQYHVHDWVSGSIKINGTPFVFGTHSWNGACGGISTFPVKKGSVIDIDADIYSGQFQPGLSTFAFFISLK